MSEFMDSLLNDDQRGFVVDNDQKALWAINKIRERENEAKALLEHYERQAETVKKTLDQDKQYFYSLLLHYFHTLPRKITKTQETYALPGATLVLKKQGPEYKRDAEKLLAYLKSNAPEFIKAKVVEMPAWDDYKKRVVISGGAVVDAETGEVVDGVTVEERPDKFEVKFDD